MVIWSVPRRLQQIAILIGALASALVLGPILLTLNDTKTVYLPAAQVAPGLRTDASKLTETETLKGPQAKTDSKTYRVWQQSDSAGGPAKKYLVDDTGAAVYLVDPGINGSATAFPDGTPVRKFDAPKAVLMSYIIQGILDQKLPWGLVLFGIMIAITLEMCGIPSLAFAVGVYLPLATSAPILSVAPSMVDHKRRQNSNTPISAKRNLLPKPTKTASLAPGYIAGGAIAGTSPSWPAWRRWTVLWRLVVNNVLSRRADWQR